MKVNKMNIKIKATNPNELQGTYPTFAEPLKMEVEAEQIGDVLVYESPTSKQWVAKNVRTGFVTNNSERQRAINEASFANHKI